MLKVENLTKIYNAGEDEVKALNNISFTLDDKGFVFITGKSGCGKSTLLNMLGGLDNLTSGTIICDGNDLSKFKNSDFDNYRNTYLGFVFQDYCLIEELTVRQNIELSLNIKGVELSKGEKEKLVDNALTSVDLDLSIKDRLVKQLSGGQKQRVAIARALIKDPKLILADEPTGNLDSRTSNKILKLLKKLSQDRLVVIVSHNKDDAKNFASRIIELADGEIKSDIMKKENVEDKVDFSRGVLTLPNSTTLTTSELKEINEKLQKQKIRKIKQRGSGFVKTKEPQFNNKIVNIEPKKMKVNSAISLASYFMKKRWFASIVTILIISLLVFVLGLCQFLIQFNEPKTAIDVLKENNETDLLLYKGYYTEEDDIVTSHFIKFSDEEINSFYESGYTGNIYPLYLQPFKSGYECSAVSGTHISAWQNTKNIYLQESMGTLNCDEDYLIKRFGVDGKLQVLAGDLNDTPDGIIITDYMADSIISTEFEVEHGIKSYEDCVGKIILSRFYVNAVIKTDYKEKYSDLMDYFNDIKFGFDRSKDKEKFKLKHYEFISDVQKYYGVNYSINPNFKEEIFNNNNNHSLVNYANLKGANFSQDYDMIVFYPDESLKDNEIAMEYEIFNARFGKTFGTYNEENYQNFKPITITLTKYDGNNENPSVVYSVDVTISKLLSNDHFQFTTEINIDMICSPQLHELFRPNSMYIYGLYLDDTSSLSSIYNTINNNPYLVQSPVYSSIQTIGDIVVIFEDLFGLILFGIGGVSVVLLISYAYGNIKKRYYEIGVLKALGATTKNVGFVFSLQTILAGLAICLISTILLLTLTNPINLTISNKLLEFISNENLSPLTILKINIPTLLINTGVIVLVTMLSCFAPLIKLNKIKPKKIISNKD